MSIAYENVFTTLDHVADAAAMLVLVIQAVCLQIVDDYGRGALCRDPGLRTAARDMDALISDSQSGPAVH
jgi:hypothetical protein